MEEAQILPSGVRRERNILLSEKLIGKENWRDAVYRAVQEELGSASDVPFNLSIDETSFRCVPNTLDGKIRFGQDLRLFLECLGYSHHQEMSQQICRHIS